MRHAHCMCRLSNIRIITAAHPYSFKRQKWTNQSEVTSTLINRGKNIYKLADALCNPLAVTLTDFLRPKIWYSVCQCNQPSHYCALWVSSTNLRHFLWDFHCYTNNSFHMTHAYVCTTPHWARTTFSCICWILKRNKTVPEFILHTKSFIWKV